MCDISVIMPVYNAGIYLDMALKSLFMQTFNGFELICVDDNSDDPKTIELLEDYAKLHGNMSIMHLNKRVGAARARNKGLSVASGKYVIFLDADDEFDNTFLEEMYKTICRENAEICLCGYREKDMASGSERDVPLRVRSGKYPYEDRESELYLSGLPSAPWNKLCRRSFLMENRIFFQNLTCCNDVAFSLQTEVLSKRIVCANNGQPKLTYKINSNNQISAFRNALDLFDAYVFIKNRFITDSCWDLLMKKQIFAFLLEHAISELRCENSIRQVELYQKLRELFSHDHVKFISKKLNNYTEWFRSYEDLEWCLLIGNFDEQLKNNSALLDRQLHKSDCWMIWGNGKRSIALQRYMNGHNNIQAKVCESLNENVGKMTDEGLQIASCQSVCNDDYIIASNQEIYEMLIQIKGYQEDRLVNLEEFCPFG